MRKVYILSWIIENLLLFIVNSHLIARYPDRDHIFTDIGCRPYWTWVKISLSMNSWINILHPLYISIFYCLLNHFIFFIEL